MDERYPRIRHYTRSGEDQEPWLFIRESVNITFYMRRSHPEIARVVLAALATYLQVVGERALGWYTDAEGDWRELDDPGWEATRQRLLNPRGAHLTLAGSPDDLTGYEFTYHGRSHDPTTSERNAVCAVSFWLPTEAMESRGPEQVRDLALKLAEELPFDSGHAGLALLFPEGLLGTTESLREVCARYPGLDVPGLGTASLFLGTSLKGVHWLNFLGPSVWAELDGADGLRSRLHMPGSVVRELMTGDRGVISLGAWPEAGDVAEGRGLPAYRELAHVLEPWLYVERFDWGGFSREDMRRWQRRFLD